MTRVRLNIKKFVTTFLPALLMISASTQCRSEVEFDKLNGSDLGMGIGARAIGMAGAFVSIADDASAIFWNPSGLTQVKNSQIFLSIDLPADFSSAAFIYKPDFRKLKEIDFTIGIGLVNRLSFEGDSGSGTWEGYPSHLLDMAMIDIDDDFSGGIDSNTYDIRLSMAMIPKNIQKLSLGINLDYIH
jgi:hypothetical protein